VLTMNFMVMFHNICKGEISYSIHFKTVEFSFSLNGKCSLKCKTKSFERPLGCHLYEYMANNGDHFCSNNNNNNNNNKTDSPSTPIYPVSFIQNVCEVIKYSGSKKSFFFGTFFPCLCHNSPAYCCAITHLSIPVP
jgi:hypothetical protein